MFGFYPLDNPLIEKCETVRVSWGGDVSNVAIGIARLGHEAIFFTGLGTDSFGNGFIDLWRENGVDVSQIVRDPARKTGFYFISFVDGRHELTYHRDDSAASALTFSQLDERLLHSVDAIHFTGTGLGMGDKARQLCKQLVDARKGSDCIISFDVNYRESQWNDVALARHEIASAINGGVTHLEITDDEMLALGWGDDLDWLMEQFPHLQVIAYKQGAHGSTIKTHAGEMHIPAFDVPVTDTVGAGDSFAVGFLTSLLEGRGVHDAARRGNASGALTCMGMGPIESAPTRDELESFLENLCV